MFFDNTNPAILQPGGGTVRVKLIAPRMSLRPMDSEFKRRLSPSLSLVTLAALMKAHYVYIEDANIRSINFEDQPDLVGISVNVDTAKNAYAIALRYKAKGIPVILGGIHASANPQEALNYADSVCIGDAEPVIDQILHDAQNGGLRPIYQSQTPVPAEQIPIPDWSLIQASEYLYTNVICSSRGCPYQCEFCYNSSGYVNSHYVTRPINAVLDEITRMPTKQVMFIDDNFIGNPKHTAELVKAIKPLGLTWHAAVSANIVNMPELLAQMSASGCRSLFIGFESINSAALKGVSKHQNNIAKYEQLVQALHSRGIMINASLVFGFDQDQPDVFANTLAWLVANKIESMTAHILTPYPGTKLFAQMQRQDRIIDYDTDKYNTANVVFQPANMTPEQLLQGYLWIYDQFYSLTNIFKRLPADHNQRASFLAFNLGYRKFGKITSLLGRFGQMSLLGRLGRRLAYQIE
jgi:radical SAM superfamily enzyme YgiQ (UPF0313 family)